MSTFLEEKEVSLVSLSLELEMAALEHTVQDNVNLYVNEEGTFPFWIRLYPDSHMMSFSTYVDFDDRVKGLDRLRFCNLFNESKLAPSVHVAKNRLYADYAMSYRDGLIRSQFIRMCRSFSSGAGQVQEKLSVFADGTHEADDASS